MTARTAIRTEVGSCSDCQTRECAVVLSVELKTCTVRLCYKCAFKLIGIIALAIQHAQSGGKDEQTRTE